jgi:hypothetical protein
LIYFGMERVYDNNYDWIFILMSFLEARL